MKASDTNLDHVSELVRSELANFLSKDFVIAEVTSELWEDTEGDDYVRTLVILQDGHPELDGHVLNQFSRRMHPLCAERGFDPPTIAYANRSEIPA